MTSDAPLTGADDQFEKEYMAALNAMLVRHGIPLNYTSDRAGIDGGLHLHASENSNGGRPASQTRVWFQAKGKHTKTLSLEKYETQESVEVSERASYVRYWYAHPEPVYLVVYIEAANEFIAEDVRDIVDRQWPLGNFYSDTEGKERLTLRVLRSAALDGERIKGMLAHRSMRIDGPSFRGRPLGHRFDPLRSKIEPGTPDLIQRLSDALLEAHDFRLSEPKTVIAPDLAIIRGRLYETMDWQSPMFAEFGFGPDDDFRIEPNGDAIHGDVAFIVDHANDRSQISDEYRVSLSRAVNAARADGATVAVIANMSEMSSHSGLWRAFLREGAPSSMPSGGPLIGLESLTSMMLIATLVYMDFSTEVVWSYVNFLR